MGIRFNNSAFLNQAKAFINSWDKHFVSLGKPYRVYKFRKVSGIVRMTNTGEKGLEFNPQKFSQNLSIYTGKEPVVVAWENSTELVGIPKENTIEKKVQVGVYYDLYSNSDFDIENTNQDIELLKKNYVAQFLSKDIALQSLEWFPNDSDILDYVYMVIDHRGQSYQWLEINTVNPVFNEETGVFEKCEIQFSNINIKYAASGKNILDFFQLGAIGEGYAFPMELVEETENEDGSINKKLVTQVDGNYINDVGLDSIQYDFFAGAATSSFAIWGRQASIMRDNKLYVNKTQRLFLHDELFPLSSQIFFNQPNSNSFWCENAKPDINSIWESYKAAPEASMGGYNMLSTKEVLTGLKMDNAAVLETNSVSGDDSGYSQENWFNSEEEIAIKGGYGFRSVAGIQDITASTDPNYAGIKMKSTMFYNFNTYVNFSSDVFNYDFKETKKYKLADTLGVLGGLVNVLIGGLDIGWTSTTTLAPNQPMNLRFPCISFLIATASLQKDAPIPMDVFIDEKAKSIVPVSTNIMTSHRFSLTDLIQDTSQVRLNAPEGKGGNGIWNTRYIGQKTFEDGTYINEDLTEFEFNVATTKTIENKDNILGWVIDADKYHVISIADMRTTAYKKVYNPNSNQFEDIPVYSSLTETIAKALNDVRFWGTTRKFNFYDRFNVSGKLDWPVNEVPPEPPGILKPVVMEPINWDEKPVRVTVTPTNVGGINTVTKDFGSAAFLSAQIKLQAQAVNAWAYLSFSFKPGSWILSSDEKVVIKSLRDIEFFKMEIVFRCKTDVANAKFAEQSIYFYGRFDRNGDEKVQKIKINVATQQLQQGNTNIRYLLQYGGFGLTFFENYFKAYQPLTGSSEWEATFMLGDNGRVTWSTKNDYVLQSSRELTQMEPLGFSPPIVPFSFKNFYNTVAEVELKEVLLIPFK